MPFQELQLSDGRILEYFDSGLASDRVIIAHHGTPGYGSPWSVELKACHDLGLRLICITRPGYHRSSRLPGRTIASIAKDVESLLRHLQIDSCASYGLSGGGPHALACGALLPDRVRAVASISGVGPYDTPDLNFLDGMGADNLDEFGVATEGEASLRNFLQQARDGVTGATIESMTDAMSSLLSQPDVQAMRQLGQEMVDDFEGALSAGIEGWLDDDLAFVRPWAFEVEHFRVPVQVWQGQQDLMVPPSHGDWLARHIPHAELLRKSDEGHLSILLNHAPEIYQWLASYL